MAHPDISGAKLVGPSPIAADDGTSGKMLVTPRALDTADPDVVGSRPAEPSTPDSTVWRSTPRTAIAVPSDSTNARTDRYGGSAENRARYAEVVEAVADEIGARVGCASAGETTPVTSTRVDTVSAHKRPAAHRISTRAGLPARADQSPIRPSSGNGSVAVARTFVLTTGREVGDRFRETGEPLVDWGVVMRQPYGRFWPTPTSSNGCARSRVDQPDVATFYCPGRSDTPTTDVGRDP